MIAGVDVAVMFDGDAFSADFAVHAHLRRQTQMLGHERLEMVDQHLAHVFANPHIKGADQEIPPVIGIHGPVRDNGLRVAGASFGRAVFGKFFGIPGVGGCRWDLGAENWGPVTGDVTAIVI